MYSVYKLVDVKKTYLPWKPGSEKEACGIIINWQSQKTVGQRPHGGHQAEKRRVFTEELADPCSIMSHISITGNKRIQIIAI